MNPLATLYSTIDSIKRVLADRLSDPIGDLQKTAGRASEDAAAFREKQKKGGAAATDAMLETVLNFSPAGMIGKASLSNITSPENLLKAEALIKRGKSLDAYEQFGVFKDNRLSDELLQVIDDKLGLLRTSKLAKTTEGSVTAKGSANSKELADSSWRSSYAANKLTELLDQPELYAMAPALKDTLVVRRLVDRPFTTPGRDSANYTPALNTIQMGEFPSVQAFYSSLLHEVNHAVATSHGLPAGSSPRKAYGGTPASAIEFLRVKAQTDQLSPDSVDRQILQSIANKAFSSYKGDPGESISRLTQEMFRRNDYITHPLTLMRNTNIVPTPFVGPYEVFSNQVQEVLSKYKVAP